MKCIGSSHKNDPARGSTSSTHSTSQSGGQKTFDKSQRMSKAVWAGRIIFLVALVLVAALLGYAAYVLLSHSETSLATVQFKSIADRAMESALGITARKRLGTVSMASVASHANPNASDWPFVVIEGYEEMSTYLIETSSGREMGFCPLVVPENLAAFEDFAYNYYENARNPPFPNGTATSSFGKGVWGVNPKLETKDKRYHETDGSTSYGSPNKIFTPILHHNEGPHKALMLNLHFQETRGKVIDYLIECAEARAKKLEQNSSSVVECISVTDMLILTSQEVEPGPGALIMQPIYPANDPEKVGASYGICLLLSLGPRIVSPVAYLSSFIVDGYHRQFYCLGRSARRCLCRRGIWN